MQSRNTFRDEEGLEHIELNDTGLHKAQSLLTKARTITSAKKEQIKEYKRTIPRDAFITDIGLESCRKKRQTSPEEYVGEVDENYLLKEIMEIEGDPLQDLRKLIKKTNKNLNSYGRNLRNLKDKIEVVADEYGKSFVNFNRYEQYLPKRTKPSGYKSGY